jgi:hypothetical protein
MRKLLLVLFICLLPSIARAEPPEASPLTPVPSGPDVITVVKKGEPAPHDGQLFDQATAIRWANFLQQAHMRLRMDSLFQYKIDQVELEAQKKILELERAQYKRVTEDLHVKLAEAQKDAASPAWYRTATFGFTAGVVGTILVVVGAAILIKSAE